MAAPMNDEFLGELRHLEESRSVLLQRLQRVLTALSLTLDAEVATRQRMSRNNGDHNGVARLDEARASAVLAGRYRQIIRTLQTMDFPRS